MKGLFLTGAIVGALAALTIPAAAADRVSPVTAYTGASWADVTAAVGVFHTKNKWDDENRSALFGEGRVGFGTMGFPFQVDVNGQTTQEADEDSVTHMDLAAHVGFYNLAGGGLGAMVSAGSGTRADRAMTIALEGVWGLNVLGGARLVAQGGWTTGSWDRTATYVHAVLEFLLQQNVMLSVNGGFANTSDDEHYTRFGAKGELAFNPTVSGFVQGDWLHKTEGHYSRDDNRFLIGATFHVNQGSLASVSPLHDFNIFTGVNADIKR
jgi:hypothetical protein